MVSVADFFSRSATVGAEVNQKLIGHYRMSSYASQEHREPLSGWTPFIAIASMR
ncbi:hypothetical protein OSCI_3010021 [Kamptonema sp. PCC 6506]|nr:hypothetical protein OSCI_3010021 [Kamptonema sp. PCC 6506]